MRHGSLPEEAITLLAAGVTVPAFGSFLVPPSGLPDRAATRLLGTFLGTVALAAVAATADMDLQATEATIENPVTLFDGGYWPSTGGWTKSAKERYLLLVCSFTEHLLRGPGGACKTCSGSPLLVLLKDENLSAEWSPHPNHRRGAQL